MTSGPDISNYDPFEDTGDWPFRDAPPKPERDVAPEPESKPPEPQVFESTELSQPAIEDDPELESEPPIEELLPVALEPELESAPDLEPAPEPQLEPGPEPDLEPGRGPELEPAPEPDLEPKPLEPEPDPAPEPEPFEVAVVEEVAAADVVVEDEAVVAQHAPGELLIPPGVEVLAGGPHGFRRNVAVVVSRFNGDITTGLLDGALAALRECNVGDDAITVVPVPGAFELPLTALALAKTRRYSCVVALGCIIRGETPHFDLIASEAASGLQLAAIETGIPVAFGVITTETREQAEERVDRGGEAARTALEMADLFSHVRTRAAAS